MIRQLISHLRRLIRRRQIGRETDDEFRFNVEMETDANRARGLSPGEARLVALRELGGVTQTRDAVRDVRASWLDAAWQDLRYSLRMLRRSPAFTLLAILVLALGIGVNTAVFSIINSVFFRQLPVDAPDELVYLYEERAGKPGIFPFGDLDTIGNISEVEGDLRGVLSVFPGAPTLTQE
jgi:hypothetical protein